MAPAWKSLIHHFKLWTEGFHAPAGSVYVAIESPRGELGVYLESDGSPKPYRVHFRTPSFVNLQIMPLLTRGHFVADVVGIIGSIDIVLGDATGERTSTTKYPEEVERILAKYPPDFKRSAVMPLLYLAQREAGLCHRARRWPISPRSWRSRRPKWPRSPVFTPCIMKNRTGATASRFATICPAPCAARNNSCDELCEYLGVEVGETTPDGLFTVEAVKCLAACHRAPMFQVQGDGEIVYHENQTLETAMAWIEEVRGRKLAQRQEEAAA